jgi:hypothetical protein
MEQILDTQEMQHLMHEIKDENVSEERKKKKEN